MSLANPITTVRERAGVYHLTATQEILEVPVFSAQLRFTYDNAQLTQISGTVLPDAPSSTKSDHVQGVSSIDALLVFLRNRDTLGWVGNEIISVTQGYFRTETASAAIIRLAPGWQIATDVGTFFVNGMTQEILATVD